MDAKELRGFVPELNAFVGRFDDCFSNQPCREHLPVYIQGQASDLDRKSVEPIALRAGIAPRTLQEFLSLLNWNQDRMRQRTQEIVATEHAGPHSIGLIDETSFVKKGTKSPGVQRQWCGTLGKVENCVVTVHLGYVVDEFHCLLEGELFLPESWDNDRERCAAAGIPETVRYRPKWQIALEQYDRAVANGVRFEWLTFDEHYGSKPEFLRELSKRKQAWVAEVPKNVHGWLSRPSTTNSPRRTSPRGRRPKGPCLLKGSPPARRLDELLKRHPKLRDQPWQRYRFDERSQGPSVWEAKHVRLHVKGEDGLPGETWHLVVARHVLQQGEVKYFLSNAADETATETLLWVALTRHRVEQCFKEQKSQLGLDHYEGRTYIGFVRHLALTCVSYLFLTRAVLRRREKKSGVDRPAGPSGAGRPDQRHVA